MMAMSLPHNPESSGLILTHSSPGRSGSGTSRIRTGASLLKRTRGHLRSSRPVSRYCGMLY